MKIFSKKYSALTAIILAVCMFMLGACGEKDYGEDFTTEPLTDSGYAIESITIEVPGLTQDYDLLLVADLHLLYNNDEVCSEDKDVVAAREKGFSPDGGKTTAASLWETMPDLLNKCNADYVLFAGDMVDFNSVANIDALKKGLDRLNTPYCYVRSDHDVVPFYMDVDAGECDGAAIRRQNDIGVNSNAWYVDLGEIVVLCYNRSDKVISDVGIDVVREAIAIGKPIVMLSHVPFNSIVDTSLDESCKQIYGGRNLTWAKYDKGATEYTCLDAVGCDFLDLVYDADNGIKEIVCGHLHYSWDGEIAAGVRQHVFSPAFVKIIGHISIRRTE